jgi:hypothetical protein
MRNVISFGDNCHCNSAHTAYRKDLIDIVKVVNRYFLHKSSRAIKDDVVIIDLDGISLQIGLF